MQFKSAVLTILAASLALGAMPAAAQVEEVIVTARKREESLLKVPVIATVVDASQLERHEIRDITGIAGQVSGLIVGQSNTANGVQLSLRGVGTASLSPAIDQSISLNIDGQQMTQGLAFSAAMFDLSQVQVLKGPQALFYGKSSPGGVVAIRSADPTDKFEVMGRGSYETEARTRQGEFVISGPITDALGARLAIRYSDSDGYWHNRATAIAATGAAGPKYRRVSPTEEYIARGTVLWKPTDRFSARLKLTMTNKESEGGAGGDAQLTSCPDGTTSPVGIPFLAGEDCKLDRNINLVDASPAAFPRVRNGGVPFLYLRQIFPSAELKYEISDTLGLTSVTGFYHVREHDTFNGSASTAAGPAIQSESDFRRKDFTQELRLDSSFNGPVNFTLGGLYEDGLDTKYGTAMGNTFYRLPAILLYSHHRVSIKSESVFGQARWHITPKLELGGGVRWTDERRTHQYENLTSGTTVVVPLGVPKISSKNASPEITLTYTPTDDMTVFGSFKQAHKSGSFNASGSYAPGDNSSFGDEKVSGGEVGLKTRWLDRQLAINLAGYTYKFSGLQVGASTTSSIGLITVQTINAASARVYGADLDMVYAPYDIKGLTVRGALNWNHARYITFNNAPCWGGQMISEGCTQVFNPTTRLFTAQDLSGKPLLRAPSWQGNLGFDYEMPIGPSMKLAVGTTLRYSSSYYADILDRNDMLQSAYGKLDVNLALKGDDDRWEVAFISNNVTNKLVRSNCTNGNLQNGSLFGGQITGGTTRGPAGIDEIQCYADPGREMWLRVTLRR